MINTSTNKTEIGWREWVSLPELCLPAIKAKIDTGAKTSALHTFKLERVTKNSVDLARFWIHPLQNNDDTVRVCESPIVDCRQVKDSGGHTEERFIIQTSILLNDKQWQIEISLTNRENMLFRMLLGRSALIDGGFIVNPGKSFNFGIELESAYTEQET